MPSKPLHTNPTQKISLFLITTFLISPKLQSRFSGMKKSVLAASVAAAASATAASLSSSSHQDERRSRENSSSSQSSSSSTEKFAPRFDGLRFIETLVTAHR